MCFLYLLNLVHVPHDPYCNVHGPISYTYSGVFLMLKWLQVLSKLSQIVCRSLKGFIRRDLFFLKLCFRFFSRFVVFFPVLSCRFVVFLTCSRRFLLWVICANLPNMNVICIYVYYVCMLCMCVCVCVCVCVFSWNFVATWTRFGDFYCFHLAEIFVTYNSNLVWDFLLASTHGV